MKKIVGLIATLIAIVTLTVTIGFAANDKYSIEDLYIYYGESSLPSWKELQDTCTAEYEEPEDEVEKQKYRYKRNMSSAVITGFEKASNYNSFKKDIEKHCEYDSEHQELIPKGYNIEGDTDLSEKELRTNEEAFDNVVRKFDKAISQASIRGVMDMSNISNGDNWITRQLNRLVNAVIGTVMVVIQNLDRIAVVCMSLQMTAELIYMAVDISRPILGYEGLFKKRKIQSEDDGSAYIPGIRTTYQDDHSTQFRLVGRAARLAVEQEYKISEDMSTAFKNDIFKCYLANKGTQILMIVISVLFVYTSLWSEMLVWIAGLISQI